MSEVQGAPLGSRPSSDWSSQSSPFFHHHDIVRNFRSIIYLTSSSSLPSSSQPHPYHVRSLPRLLSPARRKAMVPPSHPRLQLHHLTNPRKIPWRLSTPQKRRQRKRMSYPLILLLPSPPQLPPSASITPLLTSPPPLHAPF